MSWRSRLLPRGSGTAPAGTAAVARRSPQAAPSRSRRPRQGGQGSGGLREGREGTRAAHSCSSVHDPPRVRPEEDRPQGAALQVPRSRRGWTCKLVLRDKQGKTEKDRVFWWRRSATKQEAEHRVSVVALAAVAQNLPLQRLLPASGSTFADAEEAEKERAEHRRAERPGRKRGSPRQGCEQGGSRRRCSR